VETQGNTEYGLPVFGGKKKGAIAPHEDEPAAY
jgi:hypothetical protein